MKFKLVALLALSVTAALLAQEFRGTISGVVTDPTGAAVPGAKVLVTEIRTGTKSPAVSDSAGQYAIPFLAPGDYRISVQFQGFKELVRTEIHLGSGEHPIIDLP